MKTQTSRRREGQGRRAPEPEARKRDAERTRTRILDAARHEFGARGLSGARVSAIAARAGVNVQLISYYFGGKAGLYEAVANEWARLSAGLNRPELPLEDLVAGFLAASLANPSEARLLAWQGLTDGADAQESEADRALMAEMVNDMRRRQGEGELAPDLDARAVLLALFGAVSAPILLPQIARRIYGSDSGAPVGDEYGEHLRRIVREMRPGPGDPSG